MPIPNFQVPDAPDTLSSAPLETLVHSWKGAIEAHDNRDQHCEKWNQMLQVVQHIMSLQTCISTVRFQAEQRQPLSYDECKALHRRLQFQAKKPTLESSATQMPSYNPEITSMFSCGSSSTPSWISYCPIECLIDHNIGTCANLVISCIRSSTLHIVSDASFFYPMYHGYSGPVGGHTHFKSMYLVFFSVIDLMAF